MDKQGLKYAFQIYALAKHNYSKWAYQLLFGIPMMREWFDYHIEEGLFDSKLESIISDLQKVAEKAKSNLTEDEINKIFQERNKLND